ncbi:unnamed protein product [Rotaria magnacalcarata]|uniref:Uncharacterized protein n=1 Tax=Rotaria magnacalcarata TaxID=392030 RepID=A0A818ZJ55_9BILA|nr:unnamed protein product [Rotaria magnacalcarata]CAF3768156.1 unnamed protein product [Rotaria magnacalcarata]
MEIALVENDYAPPTAIYKHDWVHIFYMGTCVIFFVIQVYQRISVDLIYSSRDFKSSLYIPSLNRYPTELTPTVSSMSYIWYVVFIWQAAWIIYSVIGIFRRTSSGTYFYQHPCAMNKWCYFYTVFGLILFTPQLTAASRNKYGIGISIFRHLGTLCELLIILVVVHVSLWENVKSYLRNKFFADIWLTRLLYHNGLALWASVIFYESCLSIIIGLIYGDVMSSSTASIIGCLLLCCVFIVVSVLENFVFYNALAFTLSPWFVFLWILGDIVFRVDKESSSSVFTFWGSNTVVRPIEYDNITPALRGFTADIRCPCMAVILPLLKRLKMAVLRRNTMQKRPFTVVRFDRSGYWKLRTIVWRRDIKFQQNFKIHNIAA